MAKITDLGRYAYFQKLYWLSENPPIVHTDHTSETEYPFRSGRCLVLRVPFTKTALVFGVWTGRRREQEALLAAMGARITRDNGITVDGDW